MQRGALVKREAIQPSGTLKRKRSTKLSARYHKSGPSKRPKIVFESERALSIEDDANSKIVPKHPIPSETLCDVFKFLSRVEAEKCQLVCQNWSKLVTKNWSYLARHRLYSIDYREEVFIVRTSRDVGDFLFFKSEERARNLLRVSVFDEWSILEMNMKVIDEILELKKELNQPITDNELTLGSFFSIPTQTMTTFLSAFTPPTEFCISIDETSFNLLLVHPEILKVPEQQKEVFIDFSRAFGIENFATKFLLITSSKKIQDVGRYTFGMNEHEGVCKRELSNLCGGLVHQLLSNEDLSEYVQHYRFRLAPHPLRSEGYYVNTQVRLTNGWKFSNKFIKTAPPYGTEEYLQIDVNRDNSGHDDDEDEELFHGL